MLLWLSGPLISVSLCGLTSVLFLHPIFVCLTLQVHIFSFQCTQLCTPESVIEVFKQAERFQANQDINQYVSVVVLDEVGLAEDSPSLPLKALHPLLEDGTDGSDKNHQQQVGLQLEYLHNAPWTCIAAEQRVEPCNTIIMHVL